MKETVVESQWLANTAYIEDLKWIKGAGALPAAILVIGDHPGEEETASGSVFYGPSGKLLFSTFRKFNLPDTVMYFTNAIKYNPPHKRAVNAGDIKKCKPYLEGEFEKVQPQLVVCLGANALKACMGRNALLSDYRGALVDIPDRPDIKLFTTYNPAHILRNPQMLPAFEADIATVAQLFGGGSLAKDKTSYEVIQTVEHLRAFKEFILAKPAPLLSVDAEWHGATWMSKDRYIRTVQLGYDIGAAVVIEFTGVGGVQVMDRPEEAWQELKVLLEHPKVKILGQNVISDAQWLMSYGIDIRPNIVFDTMLAEHVLNESGPFGLEMLTLKYTDMGRYDMDVLMFVKANKALCKGGYGYIPRELLLPYGAKDVDTVLRIAKKQMELMEEMLKPNGSYPSLWDIEMQTQQAIFEMEQVGMAVDPQRLEELIKVYNERAIGVETVLKTLAQQYGMTEFNYNAVAQVKTMLFGKLGLIPIKDTKGREWTQGAPWQADLEDIGNPSTDKNTLEILQEAHPFVKMLLNMRRIGTAVKYFLRDDEEEDTNEDEVPAENQNQSGGGIKSKIWPDGRLHAHFSQLSETGRLKHSKPNVANWPKKAEGYMAEIFGGKDKVPPLIRTIVVPSPGYVLMEADFEQAELFVLAALSHDPTMWEALNTPGKDLHDLTAINAFKLLVVGTDGQPVNEQFMLDMAKKDKKAFEAYVKTLTYVDQRGKRMTRSEFKDTIRVSAKNLNFGIPYGRGAADIARQVKGETGLATPLLELEKDIEQMMKTWKEESYPVAWAYMQQCAASVTEPGYLVNPWGRKRRFPKSRDRMLIGSMKREAQNYPIQSTVADTCMLAMMRMRQYRVDHGLGFRIVNQIHDAVMVEVPESEIEATKKMFKETMGNIQIPVPGSDPLQLGIDISILDRWGQKRKKD